MSAPAQGAGGVLAWWRSSLRLRVIAITMLLGMIVTAIIGTVLFAQVAEGLVSQAKAAATADAAQEVRNAQELFDAINRSDETSLNATAAAVVNAIGPGDQLQRTALIRSLGNDRDAQISTLKFGDLDIADIPVALEEALEADPSNQQVMVRDMSLSTADQPVPSVLVGAQVDIPRAGPHNLIIIYSMAREQATLDLIRQWFAVGGVALLGLMGAVAWVAASLVARPVGHAARVSQQMAQGHLDERLSVRGSDELDQLAMSFNTMADSIQSQIQQLETLSRLQQRFVSDVSHELRTPLTTIRMAGEVLHASREDFPAPVARSAELLYEELDRFEALLTELLEISRYDSGAADLELDQSDLRGLVHQVLEALTALSAHSGSAVRLALPEHPVVIEMDQRRVSRILRNLIANALDHGEGRPVDISLTESAQEVRVAVRDHGVGLTAEQAALVFDRFWRGDPARNRTAGGTGLGLAIASEDARLHGGHLQVAGAPGKGAVFQLVLPRVHGHTLPAPPPLELLDRPQPVSPTVAALAPRHTPGPGSADPSNPAGDDPTESAREHPTESAREHPTESAREHRTETVSAGSSAPRVKETP